MRHHKHPASVSDFLESSHDRHCSVWTLLVRPWTFFIRRYQRNVAKNNKSYHSSAGSRNPCNDAFYQYRFHYKTRHTNGTDGLLAALSTISMRSFRRPAASSPGSQTHRQTSFFYREKLNRVFLTGIRHIPFRFKSSECYHHSIQSSPTCRTRR